MRHQIGQHRLDHDLERRRQRDVAAWTRALLQHPHAVEREPECQQRTGYGRRADQFERLHQRPGRYPTDQRDDQPRSAREHDRILERGGDGVDQRELLGIRAAKGRQIEDRQGDRGVHDDLKEQERRDERGIAEHEHRDRDSEVG